MKKLLSTLTLIIFFNITVFCQARYVFIEFKDAQKPAIQTEFSYPDKTVSDAIEDKLGKMGYKGKETKGYTLYKGVRLDDLGNQPYDLYFKAEKKSRKDKDNTVLSMLVSPGNEIFISDTDSGTINNAKNFINNLLPAITAYDLQQQISAQQEAVIKAEKKYKNLQEDADDLQKKKKKLEEQIQDNIKAQKDQQAEIEKQKQLFETIKTKQKN